MMTKAELDGGGFLEKLKNNRYSMSQLEYCLAGHTYILSDHLKENPIIESEEVKKPDEKSGDDKSSPEPENKSAMIKAPKVES